MSGKRKAYLAALVVLLTLLPFISRPSTIDDKGASDDAGGVLAQLRVDHDLQHSNLGKLDPSTITLKLATFGVRQVAAALLRNKIEEYKSKENWTALEATLEQAANLQPYYVGPWRHQAWNLSYNVSVEFDNWEGRYHYVKRGIKYLIEGSEVNVHEHRLKSDLGWFTGQKFGRSDERRPFRKKFRVDSDDVYPAHEAKNRPVKLRDNWLVAVEYYDDAESIVNNGVALGTINPVVFYTQGPRAYINFAEAMGQSDEIDRIEGQNEVFADVSAAAWAQAVDKWSGLGQNREIPSSSGKPVRLGADFYNDQVERGRKAAERLAELTPGVRDTIVKERVDALSKHERDLIDMYLDYSTDPPSFKSGALQPDQAIGQAVMMVRQQLLVEPQDLADGAPETVRAEAREVAALVVEAMNISREVASFREQCNYDYWLSRSEMERSPEAIAARHDQYAAAKALDTGDLASSKKLYEDAFVKWREMMTKYPAFEGDVILEEELFDAVGMYADVARQLGVPPAEDLALKDWLMTKPRIFEQFMSPDDFQSRRQEMQETQRKQPGGATP